MIHKMEEKGGEGEFSPCMKMSGGDSSAKKGGEAFPPRKMSRVSLFFAAWERGEEEGNYGLDKKKSEETVTAAISVAQ